MTDFQKLDVLKHELAQKMCAARPAIAFGNSVVLHEETRRARGTYEEILQAIQADPTAKALWSQLESAGLLWPSSPAMD
jgi:hypothetical protein